ncbi:hypothetical protein QBC41DRAFT_395920 [Cercophora samala]|uniref:Uncharacterized protein n=1 Tax=Cercophora samala TaxID=330535 RepID=A0AA39ZAS1_9PEZI|nr:hypothetical protein QBC41DRAFT_395920 [Cercophora samala]
MGTDEGPCANGGTCLGTTNTTMTDTSTSDDRNSGTGDEFAFAPIQLNIAAEHRGMHQKNDGPDEIQRPDVVDDLCLGLQLQARVDRVVHGRTGKDDDSTPATLIVFGFQFQGLGGKRRFKDATITIVFQDEKQPGNSKRDPKVVALWPNGEFTLGEPTAVQVEDVVGHEAGGDVGVPIGAGGPQVGVHALRSWEKKQSYSTLHTSKLTGSIVLDFDVRESGPKNAVRLTLSEDEVAASGLVTDLRVAVLLHRQNDDDIFTASVKIKGRGNFLYNRFRGIRDFCHFAPANDPVRFKPGVQYIRPPTLHPTMEASLAADIDKNELRAEQLQRIAGAWGSTAISLHI